MAAAVVVVVVMGVTCLLVSLCVNLDLWAQLRGHKGVVNQGWRGWTRRAAEEAEEVAAIACSGHGVAYLDGAAAAVTTTTTLEGTNPVCECRACFFGPHCSLFNHSCAADVDSGDPLFLEPFWMDHAEEGAVVVAGWHRMSYSFHDDCCNSPILKNLLLKLHSAVGNAVTTGRSILFGDGSTQLLNAAVHALASLHHHNNNSSSSSPSTVLASIPFYPVYKTQTNFFRTADFMFVGDTASFKNNTTFDGSCRFIEFVTSPNNPDCYLNKAVLKKGPFVSHIYDFAYYWPHYTAIEAPADEDIMIFTTSKLTGHAGSRLGWALVKDEGVYNSMQDYVRLNTLGVSKETQLRLTKLIEFISRDGGGEIFDFGYERMRKRWEKLRAAIEGSGFLTLQKMEPTYCTYFKRVRDPSPAYAWIKCVNGDDCGAVMRRGGVIGRNGSLFGSDDSYVRLSLLKSEDEFDLMLSKVRDMVLREQDDERLVSF